MCGIVCYIGSKEATPILIEGLKRLEYRGYDSAGIAVHDGKNVHLVKTKGRISDLEIKISNLQIRGNMGIGHTRWATHGEPTDINAHPHTDEDGNVFVVHNGIIENYSILKRRLEKEGIRFRTDTDTEVLAHLISYYFDGDLIEAVRRALADVEGTFGIAVIHRESPGRIILARRGSPIVIGIGNGEHFAASDVNAMIRYTANVVPLEDNELAVVTRDDFNIMTIQAAKIVNRSITTVDWKAEEAELNGFPHYMLKEIYEQPEAVNNAMRGRIDPAEAVPKLGGIEPVWDDLKRCKNFIIVGCGTSYHAGYVGRYIFERLTDLDVDVELASEFRYRKLNFPSNTFVLALSQSGETADTLAAIREARRKGAKLLGIVNVVGSSIARETDAGVYNHAGPEIGVASTKNFTSQLVVLTLLALLIGRHHNLSYTEGAEAIRELKALPGKIKEMLFQANHIQAIAEKYYRCNNWLFIGRKFNYPIALEGALKLKEVSYIHAEGYAAGEMKHGPIALINPEMPTVAIVPQDDMHEKMINNIQEIKSRKGPVIAISTLGDREVKKIADDVIEIPRTLDYLYPILTVIPCQLLAYYCAVLLGRDVDKPRNLAKSVTVE